MLTIHDATNCSTFIIPEPVPGDVVVMDNLSSHKRPRLRQMVEAAGAQLRYVPPYSSDFNPIENAFAKSRRSCAKPPRAPSTAFGQPSAGSSTSSHPPNAPTTSWPRATIQSDRIPL